MWLLKKILRWVRSSGVKATSSEGKREYILWKNENFHIEYTRIDDAFNTGPLFLLCSFLRLFECIPIFAFFFFIVFYFCTFSSCITMTRNNCEHMLLACDNNPRKNLFRDALTTLLFLYIFIFVLNIDLWHCLSLVTHASGTSCQKLCDYVLMFIVWFEAVYGPGQATTCHVFL